MVKFSHSLFALPFALAAAILAQRVTPLRWADLIWVLVAMVAARSAAMGFNRWADAAFDARNPRTSGREIPAGGIPKSAVLLFVLSSSIVFIVAAGMLGKICFWLSFPVLGILLLYSYTKRFTWLSHLYLGFAISLAPLGAWLALAKTFSGVILLLCLALMLYIAGFDILYACQDAAFDRKEGLYSIPVRFGLDSALRIAAVFHGIGFLCFLALYAAFDLTMPYLAAVGIIGILLILEHRLVRPDDMSRVHVAFFHINSIISAMLFCGVLADELYRRWL
jgi:4-hydroxybenzoate polyprenyltransferase